jgi:Domain of unknown function (DUF4114)
MPEIPNSLYLDFTSYGTTTYTAATTVEEAYHIAAHPATDTINVAIVLPRANDPTALLAGDWATRQNALAALEASGTLWSRYGASQTEYDAAVALLTGSGPGQLGLQMIGDASGSDGYISSAESRTIWLQLSPTDFQTLFGTQAHQADNKTLADGGLYFWNGNLSLPTGLDVAGLWFDFPMRGPEPAFSDLSGGAAILPAQGWQSIGNALGHNRSSAFPGAMASAFYNFPLTGIDTRTATVGIIEPGSGDVLPSGSPSFQQLLELYRQNAGLSPSAQYYSIANNGANYDASDPGERSLDVGVVASASPGSTIGLYAGSGYNGIPGGGPTAGAYSNVFTSFQAAFWDMVNEPPVISASYSMTQQTRPGSLFAIAAQELFVDAALRNITLLKADNDFGSSWGFANGLANQNINASSPYAVVVGGTSLTTLAAALNDETVVPLYGSAMANDPATLWQLVAGGLTVLPSAASITEATLLESVWNQLAFLGSTWTSGSAVAGDGGVDTTQQTPWYQRAFGLTPTSINPSGGTGRGAPDVAAAAGGNMLYRVPGPDMSGLQSDDGTSAAAPLWAALIAQIDTIFDDQGLPNLGYMNDLLYIAAAIAPASFNDITFGNNVSSFYNDPASAIVNLNGEHIGLSGFGYYAGPGYDLTTGLGTPNGTLLARALTAIGHSQMSFGTSPDLLDAAGGGWTSGADQSLLFQTMSGGATIGITAGSDSLSFFSGVSADFAWTNRFAQQSLQAGFDPNLVRLFDKQGHGVLVQDTLSMGEGLSVAVNAAMAQAIQGALSSPFGFVDFVGSDGVVRVARAVAVAETAGGANDQIAVVRLRQNGEDSLSISFYRVDDFNGTIDGLRPGEAGYAAAAEGRAYATTAGGTSIGGPGYGNYTQSGLVDVDAGDLIAMRLTNHSSGQTYWGFAQANENINGHQVGHLWNYGLNTWGFEDLYGGGDRDFNDLVVQLDFTSASGHWWLV